MGRSSMPVRPPYRAATAARANTGKTEIRLTEALLRENSAASDGMKLGAPLDYVPWVGPGKLMSVYPQMAPPHNQTCKKGLLQRNSSSLYILYVHN